MASSSVQLEYLTEMVEQTVQYVKKEHDKTMHEKSARSDDTDDDEEAAVPEIFAIQVERFVNVHTKTSQNMHRIFVRGYNHKEYSSVGWLLKKDVDNCLICNATFGFFCYKYSCWACGNVVCSSCRPYLAAILQLEGLNPRPDIVEAVTNYKSRRLNMQQSRKRSAVCIPGQRGQESDCSFVSDSTESIEVSKATVAAPTVSVFESSLKPTAEQLDSWNVRLSPGETMVACGSVMMKSSGPFGRAQPRQLIITTGGSYGPRIMFCHPETKALKGELLPMHAPEASVEQNDSKTLHVAVYGNDFYFVDSDRGAQVWADAITHYFDPALLPGPIPGFSDGSTAIPGLKSTLSASHSDESLIENISTAGISFKSAVLHISRIECTHLLNVEVLGSNDPYVVVGFVDGDSLTTEVKENAGDKALFSNLQWELHEISPESFRRKMKVAVFDKNDFRADVLIGEVFLFLDPLLYSHQELSREVHLDIQKGGKLAGHVVLHMMLQLTSEELELDSTSSAHAKAAPSPGPPVLTPKAQVAIDATTQRILQKLDSVASSLPASVTMPPVEENSTIAIDTQQKTVQITPIAGIVLKTKLNSGEKIFINVCHHGLVSLSAGLDDGSSRPSRTGAGAGAGAGSGASAGVARAAADGGEVASGQPGDYFKSSEPVNITDPEGNPEVVPLLLLVTPKRSTVDKSGEESTVCDAVMNSAVFDGFKLVLPSVNAHVLRAVAQILGMELDPDYKTPKILNSYKGGAVVPLMLRYIDQDPTVAASWSSAADEASSRAPSPPPSPPVSSRMSEFSLAGNVDRVSSLRSVSMSFSFSGGRPSEIGKIDRHPLDITVEEVAKWKSVLLPSEKIVASGPVAKKNPYGVAQTRQLIVTTGAPDGPRILYCDPKALTLKGEVEKFGGQIEVTVPPSDANSVLVKVYGRTYTFTDAVHGGQMWADAIIEVYRKRD